MLLFITIFEYFTFFQQFICFYDYFGSNQYNFKRLLDLNEIESIDKTHNFLGSGIA
jgi:hypothetical protein